MMFKRLYRVGWLLLLVLSACQPARPQASFETSTLLLREDFENALTWDAFSHPNVAMGAADGAYRMRAQVSQFVRGFHRSFYEDVVIDVRVLQLSVDKNNAYGVVCRGAAGESGNGYYFLIAGNGAYSIRKGQFGDVDPLVHWQRSSVVNQGAAVNRIRVVCIQDYLALYINGQFVADIRDDKYTGGFIGFAVAAAAGNFVEVAFDDLVVQAGRLAG